MAGNRLERRLERGPEREPLTPPPAVTMQIDGTTEKPCGRKVEAVDEESAEERRPGTRRKERD
jgi:hypothetical protein